MARQYRDIGGFVHETGTRQYRGSDVWRHETSSGGAALTLSLSDTISFSDSPIKDASKVLSDAITLAEAIAKLIGKPLSESLEILDSLSKLSGKSLAETVSLADSVVKDFGKVFSDSLSVSDSIDVSNLLTNALADAFSVTDYISLLLHPGAAATGLALPTLGICSAESRRTTLATLGCGSTTRRTGAATTGCATVSQRQNESASDGDGGGSGSVEIQLLIVDGFTVSDEIFLLPWVVDPPAIDGCADEFPQVYESSYAWGLTEFQDPNSLLTGQQIACHLAVFAAEVAAAQEEGGQLNGKTLGYIIWLFKDLERDVFSMDTKAASGNCDPDNPEGNSEIQFTNHVVLAIVYCNTA